MSTAGAVSTGRRDLRLLVTSAGFTALGDELAVIALTLKVKDLTGSTFAVGALLIASLLPIVLLAPLAGFIVDRFETRRTLMIAAGFQAVLAAALAFVSDLPAILVLSALLGAGTAIASPALYSLVPTVAGGERVTKANADLEVARYAGMVLGPVLAGVLPVIGGVTTALLVNAATFLVIVVAAAGIQARRMPRAERSPTDEDRAREGVRIIWRDRVLLAAFVTIAVVILFAVMDNVAEVFFASDVLQAGRWGYGLLASAWLAGMVGGASLIARRLPDDRLLPAVALSAMVAGAAIGLTALLPSLALAVCLFVIGGVGNGVATVSMRNLIVHRVPDRFLGRVFASYAALVNGVQLAAVALAAALVGGLGSRATLAIGGVGTLLAGAGALAVFGILPQQVRGTPVPTLDVTGDEVVVVPDLEPAVPDSNDEGA